MKQNPLFAMPDGEVPVYREMPEEFRSKCLFYRIRKNNVPVFSTRYPDLAKFFANGNSNRFDSMWNFLDKRWKDAFVYPEEADFVRFFFEKHLINLIYCEPISLKSFEECAAEFKKSEAYRDLAVRVKDEFYKGKMILGTIEKSCSDISFLKRLFLDDTPDHDGLTATVETVFVYFSYLIANDSESMHWVQARSVRDVLSVFKGNDF
jgi:hypothetical protein